MDARDVRIGDKVRFSGEIFTIKAIDEKYVEFIGGENADTTHISGVPLTDTILDKIGATYRVMTTDYIIQLQNGKQIILRPQMGDDNYTALVKDTSTKRKVTYLHDLQHYVWDVCKCIL